MWKMVLDHPSYSPSQAPCDFHLFELLRSIWLAHDLLLMQEFKEPS